MSEHSQTQFASYVTRLSAKRLEDLLHDAELDLAHKRDGFRLSSIQWEQSVYDALLELKARRDAD